jgi:hypothetical protein
MLTGDDQPRAAVKELLAYLTGRPNSGLMVVTTQSARIAPMSNTAYLRTTKKSGGGSGSWQAWRASADEFEY